MNVVINERKFLVIFFVLILASQLSAKQTKDFSSHFWCSKLYNPYYPLNPTNETLPLSNITSFDSNRYPPPPLVVIPSYTPILLNSQTALLYLTINTTLLNISSPIYFSTTTTQPNNSSQTINLISNLLLTSFEVNQPISFSLSSLSQSLYLFNSSITLLNNNLTYYFTYDVIFANPPLNPLSFVQIDRLSRGLLINQSPWFPVGYYFGFSEEFERVMINEAKNSFQSLLPYFNPPITKEYNETLLLAEKMGLKLHFDMHTIAQSPSSPQKMDEIRNIVSQIMFQPSLLAYYIADEPDGAGFGLDPEILIEVYREIKKIDPYHPVTIVLNCVSSAPRYYNAADIIMADPYCIDVAQPVGCDDCLGNVYDVATRIDEIIIETNNTKPIWLVIQAFGSENEHWPRLPTAQEERVMTYLSLIHGVTGLHYFLEGIPFSQPMWGQCRQLSLEIFLLSPAILSRNNKVEIELSNGIINGTAFNEEEKGIMTILIANPMNEPISFSSFIPILSQFSQIEAEVLFQNRKLKINDGNFNDILDGFGVRAYRINYVKTNFYLTSRQKTPFFYPHFNIHLHEKYYQIDSKNVLRNPSFENQHNVAMPDAFNFDNINFGTTLEGGNTAIADPRYFIDGYYSLRLINALGERNFNISCYGISLPPNQEFQMSIWAMASSDVTLNVISNCFANIWSYQLSAKNDFTFIQFSSFQLSTTSRCSFTLYFEESSSLWLDLWQLIPL